MIPTYDEAMELFCRYNATESLRMHGKSVAGVMAHFASINGEDADYWRTVGLLHDVDYEKYPDEHCVKAVDILKENGYDDEFINSVISHAWGMRTEVEPKKLMEKILYTTDELTGLITACAYMRPSRSVMDLEVSSVKKKFKDKSFAAGVNRAVILKGCEMLGMELDEIIHETIAGMRAVSKEIGL